MKALFGVLLMGAAPTIAAHAAQAPAPAQEAVQAPAPSGMASDRLAALVAFIEKATEEQTARLWGRHKIERIVARRYDWAGRVTDESVAYDIKVGDTKYQLSFGGKDDQTVGFWVRKKKAPETWFSDIDRDGRVDRGHFTKKKTPAEKRELTPEAGAEHRDFWQAEYEAALDELWRHLEVGAPASAPK